MIYLGILAGFGLLVFLAIHVYRVGKVFGYAQRMNEDRNRDFYNGLATWKPDPQPPSKGAAE